MKQFTYYMMSGLLACLLLLNVNIYGCVSFSCTNPAASYSTPRTTPLIGVQYCLPISAGPTIFSVFSQGHVGTVTITSATNNCFTFNYVPNGACGTDCFVIKTLNQNGQNFLQFQVFLFNSNNKGINPLAANPLNISVCENGTKTAQVTANPPSANNVFALTGPGPQHGSLVGVPPINPSTGFFTYNPNLNFTGSDGFLFQVDNGASPVYNQVSITVGAPPIANTLSFTGCNGSSTARSVTVSGGTPAFQYLLPVVSTRGASILHNPNPSGSPTFTYFPNGFTGPDFFIYSVTDAAGCNVTGLVNISVENPPVAMSSSFTTCNNVMSTHAFNVTGGTGNYTYTITSGPMVGANVSINQAANTFTYTPQAGYAGGDSFSYFINDGSCSSNIASVSITVQASTAINFQSNVSVCEDGSITENVNNNRGTILLPFIVSGPSHGSVTPTFFGYGFAYIYNPTAGYVGPDSFVFSALDPLRVPCNVTGAVNITVVPGPTADPVSVSGCSAGSVTGVFAPTGGSGSYTNYTVTQPNPAHGQVVPNTQYPNFRYISTASFSGPDSFSYTVQDSNGCVSPTGPVNVFIDKNAVGVPQSLTGCHNTSINGQLLATGGSGTFTFGITPSLVNNVLFTSAPIFLSQGVITAFNSTTGSFTYQFTAANPTVETFYFALIGCAQFALVPVQITPLASPTATPISFTTCEDGSYSGILAATGGSGSYNFTYSNGPNHGILNPFNATAGTFTYSPTAGFSGQDTFSYRAIDVSNGCASNQALATVTVSNVVAPTVQNLSISACEDGSVMSNFTASGGSGNYQYGILSGPTSGTLPLVNATTGEFIYQPVTNFSGIASFTYSATDITTGCIGNVGTVTIAVGCS